MPPEEVLAESKVVRAISPDRMVPYLRVAEGDHVAALRLYEWNLAISGAMFEALAVLEVLIRNAVGAQLQAFHGQRPGYWFDDPAGVLSEKARKDVADARSRLVRMGRPETPGRVVAELNFSFWRFILASRYESTLWTGHLRHAFPNLVPQRRTDVYAAIGGLHVLRNRIAHHEPIHGRDLAADMITIYRVVEWIDSDLRKWAVSVSRIRAVLAVAPQPPGGYLH